MILEQEIISQLAPLELKARRIVEGFMTGIHKSPFYGFSVEFAEHRPYNFGDETRYIDWKVYGKTERYYVKQFEEETNLRCYILLDVSPSMLFKYHAKWNKLTYATHLAASLIHLMHKQRDAVGLFTFDEQLHSSFPAKSSSSHIRLLYNQLEPLVKESQKSKEVRKTAAAEMIHHIAERINKRSMVVILSDLFENVKKNDELLSSLKHLRHKQHDVILFNMLEWRSERDLDLPDKKFTFSDLETGSKMQVVPKQIKEQYKSKMEEYVRSFRIACYDMHVDFIEVDTETSFETSLLAFLNHRRRFSAH